MSIEHETAQDGPLVITPRVGTLKHNNATHGSYYVYRRRINCGIQYMHPDGAWRPFCGEEAFHHTWAEALQTLLTHCPDLIPNNAR